MAEHRMIFPHHLPSNGLGKSPPKRSIFPEYWKQTRIRQQALAHKPPDSPLTPSPPPQEDASEEMSQSSLLESPRCGTVRDRLPFIEFPSTSPNNLRTAPVLPRRIVMPYRAYTSLSNLQTQRDEFFGPKTPPRRVVSGGTLEEHSMSCSPSLGSCLRESRFSRSSFCRKRSSSVESDSSMVRFDMKKVDVVHFEKPQENYSERGWVNHFS